MGNDSMDYDYSEMNGQTRRGHGILALVLAVAGLLITLFVGVVFGMLGVVPGTILSILGIVIGILSIRATGGRSGKGGLIVGIIAIIFSIMVTGIVFALGSFLKSEEVRESIPTLSSYADESWRGVAGLFLKMTSDGVDGEELQKEIDAYNRKYGAAVAVTEKSGS